MISMLSHYLNAPPALQSNDQHAKSLFKCPPSALQRNDQHAKSLFKSSPPLPYKAMISVLSHDLDIPPLSALQSNDQHAKSLFKFPPLCPTKQ